MTALTVNSVDDDPLNKLIKSFHTLLDEPLVVAIAGDYDLTTSSGYNSAEQTLKGLSQDVAFEEAAAFDSGDVSGLDDTSANGLVDHASSTSNSHETSSHHQLASSTDASSADHSDYVPRLTSFDSDSDETKFLHLRSMFGDLKDFDIKYALQRSKGNFQAALDDLLDIQNRMSEGEIVRGIDAFFDDSDGSSSRGKGKKGGKKRKGKPPALDLDVSNKEVLAKNQAKELKHQDEIAFLADHLLQPYDHVSNVYYRKKTSSGATAAAILEQYIDLGITSEDEENIATAKRLVDEFPKVPERYFLALLQVTDQGTQEIASLLSKHFTKHPHKERLQLTHLTTPLPNEDLEGHAGSLPGSKPLTPGSNKSSRPSSIASPIGTWDHAEVVKRINDANRSRLDASAQSTNMIRKGGYYRQGAVVYHDRAREQALYSQAMTSAAADLLVDQQSSRNKIDLHGVSVRDGVRIARTRVQAWWDNLGEYRIRKAREHPFTVITGLGRHSASGVSQLRQAVLAALFQDGWKASVETGCFVITGRR